MRTKVLVSVVAIVVLALLVGGVLVLRSEPVQSWAWSVTGEEQPWEALKGVVALALLELGGSDLELAPDAPIEHLGANPYGVNTFLQLEADPENVRRSMAAMRDAGIGWARQQFPWEDIEIHARGDFEDRRNEPHRSAWEKYDRIVDMAEDHGIQLLVRLDDPPNWAYASEEPVTHLGPPDDLEAYGDFVAAVVERYCGRVRYYQVWNEPNIYPEWGEGDVDPLGYAELIGVAAQRAREACDDVVIVSAALAPTTEAGGRNMDDLEYMQALYDAGWADDFDVLAVNAFGLWTGPTDRRVSPDRTNFSRAMLARDVMVRNGDADKAVWITEMGWDSPPPDMEAPYGRVDEETRALYTEYAYRRMAEEWPWAGPGFLWFLRRPNWDWHERPEGWFRILEPDWTQTPAYDAMAEMGSETPVLHRGRHEAHDVGLAYSGVWLDEEGPGGRAVRVGSQGSEVQALVHGTGFRFDFVEPPEADAMPAVFLVVDGVSTTEAPQAVDGLLRIERSGLEMADHLVTMRVDEGELRVYEVFVEAPDVESPLADLKRLLVAGALLVGALVVAAVAVLWYRTRQPAEA
jgi:hypothetical protein